MNLDLSFKKGGTFRRAGRLDIIRPVIVMENR